MDGVLWRGDLALDGMVDFFKLLREHNAPFALASNNSTKSREQYVVKLARMGVPDVPQESIVTSGTATAAYLVANYPLDTPIHVHGTDGLKGFVREAGYTIVDTEAPVVVASMDWDLSFETLKRAAMTIRAGATFIGTNPDTTFPTQEGLWPGTGSVLAALAAASGREPDVIIGKPNAPLFETALAYLGVDRSAALMVGDRLNTDITGAQKVGMRTALVFTGVTKPDDLTTSETQPDIAYEGLPQLTAALRSAWG